MLAFAVFLALPFALEEALVFSRLQSNFFIASNAELGNIFRGFSLTSNTSFAGSNPSITSALKTSREKHPPAPEKNYKSTQKNLLKLF